MVVFSFEETEVTICGEVKLSVKSKENCLPPHTNFLMLMFFSTSSSFIRTHFLFCETQLYPQSQFYLQTASSAPGCWLSEEITCKCVCLPVCRLNCQTTRGQSKHKLKNRTCASRGTTRQQQNLTVLTFFQESSFCFLPNHEV